MSRGPSRALENMAVKWFCDNYRHYGPSPIAEPIKEGPLKGKGGGICERDLLQMARENIWWKHAAILAGFTLEKINAPWTFTKTLILSDGSLLENWPDEGRMGITLPELWEYQIKYFSKRKSIRIRKWRVL